MLLAGLISAAFALLAPIADLVTPTPPSAPSLPWTAGQKLVYRGSAAYLDTTRCPGGVCQDATMPVEWTITILGMEEREGYRLYHLEGFFPELVWLKKELPAPRRWAIVVTPSGDVVYGPDRRNPEDWKKPGRLKSFARGAQRIFRLPPVAGDRFDCDRPTGGGRDRCRYCRCINPVPAPPATWVSKWWDNTGEDAYYYDEKRGFVRFTWEHHGTTSTVDVSLVENPPAAR